MKIAFNSSPLKSGHKIRGIGFYTKNLLENLQTNPDIAIKEFSEISEIKTADIVHYPFFDLFQRTLPLRKKFPTVVTIHDIIPLLFPQHYPPGLKGSINNFWQKLALKDVRAIITDSQSSKKDIIEKLQFNSQQIFVVPLAAEERFRPLKNTNQLQEVQKKYHLPDNFVLYIGDINWNKNLVNLAQGCIEAKIDLVLVGKGFDKKENLNHPEMQSYLQFLTKFADLETVHLLGFIPDEEIVAVMNLAQVLLLPSLYEGFGLPILEAQASGTPVITSNLSSMPEVAGDGAIFVDPYSVRDISSAITKVINDQKLRGDLIRKGFINCRKFSWKKVAEETIAVYRKIVS